MAREEEWNAPLDQVSVQCSEGDISWDSEKEHLDGDEDARGLATENAPENSDDDSEEDETDEDEEDCNSECSHRNVLPGDTCWWCDQNMELYDDDDDENTKSTCDNEYYFCYRRSYECCRLCYEGHI